MNVGMTARKVSAISSVGPIGTVCAKITETEGTTEDGMPLLAVNGAGEEKMLLVYVCRTFRGTPPRDEHPPLGLLARGIGNGMLLHHGEE